MQNTESCGFHKLAIVTWDPDYDVRRQFERRPGRGVRWVAIPKLEPGDVGAAAQSLKQKKGDETMERKQAKRKRGIPEDELAAGMFYLAAVVVRRAGHSER